MTRELRPEIMAAALWIQEQLDREPFADAGVSLSQHDGRITRIDHSLTTKTKATGTGARHGSR